MTTEEALLLLKLDNITTSPQMLRRWIRQGKIKATMETRKEGYVIDNQSFYDFLATKKAEISQTKERLPGYDLGRKDGVKSAKENQEYLINLAVKQREEELIKKGLFEDTISYSKNELLTKFPQRNEFKHYLTLLDINRVTLNRLGNWIFDPNFHILVDINLLPYPNRHLKIRLKEWYAQELFKHFENNR